MALWTTVRPREREEYDLDLVLQLDPLDDDPMALYDLVRDRLVQHADFRSRLELKKRCLRLSYASQFHLDILPARPDPVRKHPCIEVPDRKLKAWKPSNPIGYVQWFERKCELAGRAKAERAQVPLPAPIPDHLTRPLRRAVQLMKRRRDNRFQGDDSAPRSVVLTTLAGEFYRGEDSVLGALEQILGSIDAAIRAVAPRRIEVRNPTNRAELFSESWSDQSAYDAFVSFIADFRAELAALRAGDGLREIGRRLDSVFGDNLGEKAVRLYAERRAAAKEKGELRFSAPGIVVAAEQGRRSAPHKFHRGA